MTDKTILKKAKDYFKNNAYGYTNRKKKEWFLYALKINEREFRVIMHDLRKQGLMVMPDNQGSFFLVNPDIEFDCKLGIKFMHSEHNRGLHCLENAKPFKQLLPEGQIKIDFETIERIKQSMNEWMEWCDEKKM
jgi:hypothetical protein